MSRILLLFLLMTMFLFDAVLTAQDDMDLLSLIEDEEEMLTEFVEAAFKTNKVINLHSLENTASGVLDFKISHRFGFLSDGVNQLYGANAKGLDKYAVGMLYNLFGLDNAVIRIGFDYGVNDWLQAGIGRSSFDKTFDGYLKAKVLRQKSGAGVMPLSLSFMAGSAIRTQKDDRDVAPPFSTRMSYSFQAIIGRKFSEKFSLQFSPTMIHYNLVPTAADYNDRFALGVAARHKLSNRVALTAEYIYVPEKYLGDLYTNGFSVGVDIETGGHVFQLHFSNSTGMFERAFMFENTGRWDRGDIRFGFNVSRVFTVRQPKGFRE